MSTTIKPELSKNNEYWIPKHRYYELKHFVMQYPDWKRYTSDVISVNSSRWGYYIFATDDKKSPVEAISEVRENYNKMIDLVDKAAQETDDIYGKLILKAVCKSMCYEAVLVNNPHICSRSEWYKLYRKFFYLLNDYRR